MAVADADLPIWPFIPDFSSDVLETVEFLTDIITSETGSEQRRALRIAARRYFEFALAEWGVSRTHLDLFLRAYGGADVHLPVFTDYAVLADNFTSGENNFALVEGSDELQTGSWAFICDGNPNIGEKVQLNLADGVTFITKANVVNTWPKGSLVYPLVRAALTDQPTMSRKSGRAITSNAKFLQHGAADFSALDPASLDQHRGAPVYRSGPNFLNDSDYVYTRRLIDFDNTTGVPARVDTGFQSFTSQQYEFLVAGRAEHASLRSLLYYLRGRQRSLWIPTFMDDLYILADVVAGSFNLIVENVGLSQLGIPVGRQDVCITFNDDRPAVYARILAAVPYGNGEKLTVDTAFAAPFKADDVCRVSFMEKSRQDQDSIEIAHKADVTGGSTVSTVFVSYSDTRVDYVAPNYGPLQQTAVSSSISGGLFLPRIPSPGDIILYIYSSFTGGAGFPTYGPPDTITGTQMLSASYGDGYNYISTFVNPVGGNGVVDNTRNTSGGIVIELPPLLADIYSGNNSTPSQDYPNVGFETEIQEAGTFELTSVATITQKTLVIAYSTTSVEDEVSQHPSSGALGVITGPGDIIANQASVYPTSGTFCRTVLLEGIGQQATFSCTFHEGSGGDDPRPTRMSFFVVNIPFEDR